MNHNKSIYYMPIRQLMPYIMDKDELDSFQNMSYMVKHRHKRFVNYGLDYWNTKFKQCLNLEKSIIQNDNKEYIVIIQDKAAYQINKNLEDI